MYENSMYTETHIAEKNIELWNRFLLQDEIKATLLNNTLDVLRNVKELLKKENECSNDMLLLEFKKLTNLYITCESHVVSKSTSASITNNDRNTVKLLYNTIFSKMKNTKDLDRYIKLEFNFNFVNKLKELNEDAGHISFYVNEKEKTILKTLHEQVITLL